MKTTFFTNLGRIFLFVAFLSLLSAWWTQQIGGTVLGMSQEHLFNDAIVLALLGIGSLLDGIIHRQAKE
ncbi:MAG: hypothetical protein WAP52_03760 [Candidatus Sungiibacteriota bacterium]